MSRPAPSSHQLARYDSRQVSRWLGMSVYGRQGFVPGLPELLRHALWCGGSGWYVRVRVGGGFKLLVLRSRAKYR